MNANNPETAILNKDGNVIHMGLEQIRHDGNELFPLPS